MNFFEKQMICQNVKVAAAAVVIARRLERNLQKRRAKLLLVAAGSKLNSDKITVALSHNLQQQSLAAKLKRQHSKAARMENLFYAFVRGRPYAEVEEYNKPHTQDVSSLLWSQLGGKIHVKTAEAFIKWLDEDYEPSEARVKKNEKLLIEKEAKLKARKEASKKAQADYENSQLVAAN